MGGDSSYLVTLTSIGWYFETVPPYGILVNISVVQQRKKMCKSEKVEIVQTGCLQGFNL